MPESKKDASESSTVSETKKTNTDAGTSGEEQPLLKAAKEMIEYATSQHFLAIRDNVRGTVALMPIGWVGEPSLVVAEIKLEDLKSLLKQL